MPKSLSISQNIMKIKAVFKVSLAKHSKTEAQELLQKDSVWDGSTEF